MAQRRRALVVDTDIFIDYLNGIERIREILDSARHRVYYASVTRKELFAKPGLSSTESQRIQMLLLKHRLIRIDERIARCFSDLLAAISRRMAFLPRGRGSPHPSMQADGELAALPARLAPDKAAEVFHWRTNLNVC